MMIQELCIGNVQFQNVIEVACAGLFDVAHIQFRDGYR